MTQDVIVKLGALFASIIALIGAAALLLSQEASRRDLDNRVVQAVWGTGDTRLKRTSSGGLLRTLGERLRKGGHLYSAKDIASLESQILAAGYQPRTVLPILLAAKLLLMIGLPLTTATTVFLFVPSPQVRLMAIGVSVAVAILAPEFVIRMLRRPYVAALERGTPDALDLLVICTEAGMGLESALERVSIEMAASNRPIAIALATLLDDLRVLPDRREAFNNFGTRSGVEGLQRIATMLGQSLQYGTPLSHALRAIATELRRQRMVQLEAKAVKLPAKLIFPMIGFIMPSLYIVLLGSSFLKLFDSLKHFTDLAGAH